MKKPIILLMLALLLIPGLMAGCTTNQNVDSAVDHLLMTYVSGICGFTVNINLTVRTICDPPQTSGDTHSRDYSVTTTIMAIGEPHPVAKVTPTDAAIQNIKNNLIIHGKSFEQTIPVYSIYNDLVAPWNGVYWNRWFNPDSETNPGTPTSMVTVVASGSESSGEVYEVPKPGMYATVLGHTLKFSEVVVSVQEQVASYLKLKLTDDGAGLMDDIEVKIPTLGTIPAWNDGRTQIDSWYEIQLYFPLGGQLFTAIPDEMKIQTYTTTQDFRVSYTQSELNLSPWAMALAGIALSTVSPLAGLVYTFTADWGNTEVFKVGGAVRIHPLTPLQPAPNSASPGLSRWIDITKY